MAADFSRELTSQEDAWEEHTLSQLRYFRSLPLREKMQAVQGMADVLRRFAEMRARGEFHHASAVERAAARPEARQLPPPYDADQ